MFATLFFGVWRLAPTDSERESNQYANTICALLTADRPDAALFAAVQCVLGVLLWIVGNDHRLVTHIVVVIARAVVDDEVHGFVGFKGNAGLATNMLKNA